jgi:hypothetical protein
MIARFPLALLGAISVAASSIALADDDDRSASAVKLLTTIAVPINPKAAPPSTGMKSFDISWVDARTQLYYLADRSNQAVEVVDAKHNTFNRQITGGFRGFTGNNDNSGPNGVVVAGNFLFVTDAPSRVVTIDLRTDSIVGEVHTCKPPSMPPACVVSDNRADELAYDPEDSLILAVNNADDPPFATLIHVDRNSGALTWRGSVSFTDATNGAEQPQWHPGTGRFYISIPQIGPNVQDGAVKRINANGTIEATYPVKNCQPAGLTVGPNGDLLVGCSVAFNEAGAPWTRDPTGAASAAKPESVIIDARNGSIDRRVLGVSGNDEVWYNPGDNRYYLAARSQPGGPTVATDSFSPVLGIIDAKTMTLDQVVPTVNQAPGSAHSVAVDPHNNHALVPLPVNNVVLNCHTGCIGVYGSPRRADRDDD